jgi:hypothetical protein
MRFAFTPCGELHRTCTRKIGSYVTAEFERRGTMRCITSFRLEKDG